MARASIFDGKVAIITGGASGIGKALGEQLAARGARVILADRDGARAEDVAAAIRGRGGQACAEQMDVADADRVRALVDGAIAREGRLDYLFNNAGIGLVGEVVHMDLPQWQRMIDVNLSGVIHGVMAAYPRMVEQGSGHIINTSSLAGLIPTPISTAYCTTKHAIVGLSESLRGEAIGHGVRVSVACPGIVATGIQDATTYIRQDKNKLTPKLRMSFCSADVCARVILRGVERNKSIITVTAVARIAWWLYRCFPDFVATWIGNQIMRALRAPRESSAR